MFAVMSCSLVVPLSNRVRTYVRTYVRVLKKEQSMNGLSPPRRRRNSEGEAVQ